VKVRQDPPDVDAVSGLDTAELDQLSTVPAARAATTWLPHRRGMEGETNGRDAAGAVSVEIGCCSRAKGSVNEDAYLADVGHLLFGVFDGLGATAQAAEAAGLAAEAIRAAYDQHGDGRDCAAERDFLLLTVRGAGQLIAATLEDGFTTASVVKLCNGGRATALACNVGDSRVYRYTTAGVLHQCTLDDSPFSSDWELQLRLSEVVVPSGLLECTYFERRHVMDHALGERLASPRLWEVPVEDGDVLLAVSDGVTDNLTFSELHRLMHGDVNDPVDAAHRVVEAAYARSHQTGHPRAKIDDITAVAARVRLGAALNEQARVQ
jgi:serine/threonine protein phosphatase PrpC